MYPESLKKRLNYKLRELELLIRQITSEDKFSSIDIELALEKTRQLNDILQKIGGKGPAEPGEKKQPEEKSQPVVPSDPDPLEDDEIYEAEEIMPGRLMEKESNHVGEGPQTERDERPEMKEEREQEMSGEEIDKKPGHKVEREQEKTEKPYKGLEHKEEIGEEEEMEKPHERPEQKDEREDEKTEKPYRGLEHKEETGGKEPPADKDSQAPVREERKIKSDLEFETEPPEEPDSGAGSSTAPPEEQSRGQKKGPEIETVADKYLSTQTYINQAIAKKQTRKDLTDRLQARPITDLKNSIGLNEKFLFIKELFKGNSEKYNGCIDDLNNSASYRDALDILKNKYSFDEKNDIVQKLMNLVSRKHPAG